MAPPRRRRVPPPRGSRSRCLPRLERRWGRVCRRGTCKIKGERKLIRPIDKSAISSHIARRRKKKRYGKLKFPLCPTFFPRSHCDKYFLCEIDFPPARKGDWEGDLFDVSREARRDRRSHFFSGETNQLIPFDLSHTLAHNLVYTFSTIEAYSQSLSFAEV